MKPGKTIHSSQFRKQPSWFRGINGLWRASYPLGSEVKIDKDALIGAARQKTGLKELGKEFWDEPLDRLIKSIEKEAGLHPIGRFITKQRLINLLSVRLRAEACFKKYPEILEQELYPVMMIIGLQRTGTTKLQRLLAADPDNRAVLSWEALNPAPVRGDRLTGRERMKIARTSVRALKFMSPDFFAIHPVEPYAPEEDVLLLDVSFLSTTAEAIMHLPSYSSWLEQTDQSPAYAYMVKLLKLLQWQRPAKRWVLKTPHHMEFLDVANQFFPDLQLIWTHRSVYESIPSFLSMVAYSRKLFSDQVDPVQIARHWIRKNGLMLNNALQYYQQSGKAQFVNVNYKQIVTDPIGVVEGIYNDRGLPVNESLIHHFNRSDRDNPQGKYGQHRYRLSDFGVDEAYIDRYTSDYQQMQVKKQPE